jgi:hypothetical protein
MHSGPTSFLHSGCCIEHEFADLRRRDRDMDILRKGTASLQLSIYFRDDGVEARSQWCGSRAKHGDSILVSPDDQSAADSLTDGPLETSIDLT